MAFTVEQLVPSPEMLRGRMLPRLRSAIRLTWRHWIVILGIIGLGVGIYMAVHAPVFAVTDVHAIVRGNQRTSFQELYAASGIDQQNIFLIRPDIAAERVVRTPGVAASTVHLRLPAQVIIDVEEYAPLVAWQVVTTTVWLAGDGSPCPIAGDPPPLTLVDATGAAINAEGNSMRRRVLADLAAIQAARPDLKVLYYGGLEGLYFRSPAGWTVYLGNDGQIDEKLAILETTEQDIVARRTSVSMIDLRFAGHALFR